MFHKTVMIKYSDLLVPSFPQPALCTLIIDSTLPRSTFENVPELNGTA